MEVWLIALGWALFGGTHIGLSTHPVRRFLASRLGPKAFLGVYSLLALLTFGLLIFFYTNVRPVGGIVLGWGMDHPALPRVSEVLGLLAFLLLFPGFLDRPPKSEVRGAREPYGITRITRHPMNMAFALFGLAHLLTNRHAGDWVFFGGFVLYGYLGSLHQDRKLARRARGALDSFLAATSIVPFAAILARRQSLRVGEISKVGLLLGLLAAVAARWSHT